MRYEPFFRQTTRQGIGSIASTEFGTVRFSDISLERAIGLWEKGFPYLALTAEGARKLYGDLPPAERIALLKKCRTPEEVAAMVATWKKPTQAVLFAQENRLKELEPPQG